MPFEQKDNEGALFRNDRRETDSHPNARGSATIVCSCGARTAYWVSAWTNTVRQGEREGDRYQSLKFKAKDDQPARRAQSAPPPATPEEDDDIPF